MSDYTVMCAWCKKIIKEGDPNKVSHGICQKCFDDIIKKQDAEDDPEEKEAVITPEIYPY